jgi:hypothetical protein
LAASRALCAIGLHHRDDETRWYWSTSISFLVIAANIAVGLINQPDQPFGETNDVSPWPKMSTFEGELNGAVSQLVDENGLAANSDGS